MAQSYFPAFNIQFVDPTTGDPLALGKVYAYYSDGVTPAPTYNQAGNANPHPIVLDAAGCCQLKGDDSISYTIVAKSSTNSAAGSWIGVTLPSGGGGAAVTMDTIAQGTAYKKITSSQYTSLTGGSNSTLHYHSADRAWTNISGKPSTFAPSAHAATHASGQSDELTHGVLGGVALAGPGVSQGHITDSPQTIDGRKTFDDGIIVANTTATGELSVSTGPATMTTLLLKQNTSVGPIAATSALAAVPGLLTLKDGLSSDYANISLQTRYKQASVTASGGNNTALLVADYDTDSVVTTSMILTTDAGVLTTQNNVNSGVLYVSMAPTDGGNAGISSSTAGESRLKLYGAGENPGLLEIVCTGTDAYISDDAVGAKYRLPETYPTSYSIATREWVTSTYGNAAQAYEHSQGAASLTWTIVHDLGHYPIVQCWDSSGAVINGSIQHDSTSQCTVTFASSQSGGARLI